MIVFLMVSRQRDHPRVCGEHFTANASGGLITGSSPRMRGTPIKPLGEPWLPGIIPAYAGNTDGSDEKNAEAMDHPRVCGEHFQLC